MGRSSLVDSMVWGLEVTLGTLTPVLGRLMDEYFGFPRSMVKLEENLDWKVDEKVDEKGPFGVVFGKSAERVDRSTDRSSSPSSLGFVGRGMFSTATLKMLLD